NSAHPISVLANDSDLDQQNQPSPLTLKAVDNPTTKGGTVEVQGDHLLYTPANAFVGWDETTYSAIDTDGQGCAAVVKILVIGDLDGDGIDNGHDPDVDGDGVPNDEDPDDDGDGIPDDQDPDDDGDGVADQMPGTGSDTAPMLWFGLALVAGGVILTPMGRRRRA
ncbi:MAG TPA: Ig-like domain-containing protein, partial [Ilumatobacteraceae bacterium]|nr:Ig-like domain-containing protein [Ilumatobacteraceae bacterium]